MNMSEAQEIDVRLKFPFTALVAGPTGCGKTTTICAFIRKAQKIASPPPVEIIYCYSVYQDVFSKYKHMVSCHH